MYIISGMLEWVFHMTSFNSPTLLILKKLKHLKSLLKITYKLWIRKINQMSLLYSLFLF